ncbi:MAG: TolC family protein [bacterium]|nr:TolC family protein [bacterium]
MKISTIGKRPVLRSIACAVILPVLFTIFFTIFFAKISYSEPVSLSLPEAMYLALKENKIINYYYIDKKINHKAIDHNKAMYIPYLSIVGSWERTNQDGTVLGSYDRIDQSSYTLSLSQKNPLGGTASVNFSNNKNDYSVNSTNYQLKHFTSSLSLKYEQPILKGFGKSITNIEVEKAKINKSMAMQKFEDIRSAVLFAVFTNYLTLFSTNEQLRLKQEIKSHSQKIYDIIKVKVDLRKLPITDLIKMKTTLLSQEKTILELETTRKKNEKELLLSLYSDSPARIYGRVIPSTPVNNYITLPIEQNTEKTIRKIETMDIDLIRYQHELKSYKQDLIQAKNELYPELNLSVELGMDGYSANNELDSIKRVTSDNHRVQVAGTLTFPVSGKAAASKLAQTEGRIKQARITIANHRSLLRKKILDLTEDIAAIKKKLDLCEKIVSSSKENLENETERLVREKSTVINLLIYQNDFINAELDLLQTKIELLNKTGTFYLYRREMEQFAAQFK